MKFEKKVEKRVNDHLNQFVKNPYEKRRMTFPLWSKIAIPSGAFALTAGIVLSVFAFNPQGEKDLNVLIKPNVVKVVDAKEARHAMTLKSYESYMAFARKFVPSIMAENTNEEETSMSVSIPDAYLAIAIAGIISDAKALTEVLSYLELSSEAELKEAVSDIIKSLCVLTKDDDNKLDGGFNTNSIWFDPKQVALLKDKDNQLYQDLADVFGATIFMEPLTTKTAMKYLTENAVEGIPVPDVTLDDYNPSPASIMSTYTCVSCFPGTLAKMMQSEYESGEHKMIYHALQEDKLVDYIHKYYDSGYVYEGEGFHGAEMGIGESQARFFLPDSSDATATSILEDVLADNYNYVECETVNGEKRPQEYKLDIKAPYFDMNNKLGFSKGFKKAFPNMTDNGFASRLVTPKNADKLFATGLGQFSKVRFDYQGFFSSSVTVISASTSAPMPPDNPVYHLSLDHPYVFEFKDYINMQGGGFRNVPMVVGRIIDPVYEG